MALFRVSDPGRFTLHNAVRAAVVVPGAFAIGLHGLDDTNSALFAGFGSIAFLVFADFSGPRRARLIAYSALLLVGAVLISIGTLCSRSPALAAVVMAPVGFVVLFSGIINGYFAGGTTATLLSFILAVMVAADAQDVPSRLIGWGIGGVLAVTSTLLLFPERPHDRLRSAAAETCRVLADMVAEPHQQARQEAARASINALRNLFVGMPIRPTGPTAAGAAIASMVDELSSLYGLATLATTNDVEARTVRTANVAVLRGSAQRLAGHPAAIETGRLVKIREDLLDGQVRLLGDPGVRNDAPALGRALHSTWQLRAMSYATLRVGDMAQAAAGSGHVLLARRELAAVRQLVADHANLRSVWMRNTLRATAGLSLAVLVGQLASVQHSFWIVLGTLSVLRSSALGTGASVLKALLGTTIGIVIGGVLVAALGANHISLWVAFPPAIFFAAYAPRAISFAAGQAGFTVAVLVLFNLLAPAGWRVGIVRVEDVAIGFAISGVVGLLFWPRGAAAVLRRRLDDAYQACAACFAACIARLLGGPTDAFAASRREAIAREHLLDAAVRQFLSERAPPPQRIEDVATLVAGAARLRVTSDALVTLGQRGVCAPPDAARSVRGDTEAVRSSYAALGKCIGAGAAPSVPTGPVDELPPHVLDGVRTTAAAGDHARTVAAVVVYWCSEHLDRLRRLEAPIAHAARRIGQDPSP